MALDDGVLTTLKGPNLNSKGFIFLLSRACLTLALA